MKRICKQCGKEFILTQSEIDFYKSKNLSLPKRCKECRELNKKSDGSGKKQETQQNGKKQEDYSSYTYKPYKKPKGTVKKSIAAGAAIVVLGLGGFFAKDQFDQPVEPPVAVEQVDEAAPELVEETAPAVVEQEVPVQRVYQFRSSKLLNEHYEKHGVDMGFNSAQDYQEAAGAVVNNPNALHKLEKEDGDDVYYLEETNEFVVVSKDGFIRTYFCPDQGKKYYDRQ